MPNGNTSHNRRNPLPDLSEIRSDNPLAGRRGFEGSAAAFDMKSLDKHLDAVRTIAMASRLSSFEQSWLTVGVGRGYVGLERFCQFFRSSAAEHDNCVLLYRPSDYSRFGTQGS